MAGPHRMTAPPVDDEDEIEVTREAIERERRRRQEESRASMTRRSWYTKTAAADAFQAVVDDIHHATRVPKHEVVAALLEAAVAQREKVETRLTKTVPTAR